MTASIPGQPLLRLVGFDPDREPVRGDFGRADNDSAASRAVAREVRAASLRHDLDPTDPRWILAAQTRRSLEGAALTADRRRRLLKLANRLGLRPFDANLVIAIVQDEARRPVTPDNLADRLRIVPATHGPRLAGGDRSASQRAATPLSPDKRVTVLKTTRRAQEDSASSALATSSPGKPGAPSPDSLAPRLLSTLTLAILIFLFLLVWFSGCGRAPTFIGLDTIARPSERQTAPAHESPESRTVAVPLLEPGQPAPDFELADQDGRVHGLADYRGRNVVLYFYPKDDTPGCTIQACSMRDNLTGLEKVNAVVLGISPDDVESKRRFADKFDLNFTILADVKDEQGNAPVCDAYGVWQERSMYGRTFMGVVRTTYLIGPDGVILHRFDKVKPEGHGEEVIEWLHEHG